MKKRKLTKIREKKHTPKDRASSNTPERKSKVVDTIISLAEPLCESEGMELVHVEYLSEGSGPILRVYIDKENGVSLDDCSYISRQLGDVLDVDFETKTPYRLEVSSPGPNRLLRREKDFERFKGHPARIKMENSINGQKKFTGVIKGISNDQVTLQAEDRIIHLDYKEIARARLIKYNGEK